MARQGGFTLMEMMITLVIAGILGVTLVRFYKDSYHTYNLQEQVTDRNQNAHFVLTRLVEVLQQAGSGLPETGWAVVTTTGNSITIGINPRGAEHYCGADASLNNFIAVGDARLFESSANEYLKTTHILVDYLVKTKPILKVAIDVGYNSKGFTNGTKHNAIGLDSIRVTSAVTLTEGDMIYGYREDQYALSGSDLVIRPNGSTTGQMVLAENIDSLGFTFRKVDGTPTTDWSLMRSASILVRARTATPDPRLPAPGWHKISLPMNVMMRNKI